MGTRDVLPGQPAIAYVFSWQAHGCLLRHDITIRLPRLSFLRGETFPRGFVGPRSPPLRNEYRSLTTGSALDDPSDVYIDWTAA